MIHEKVVDVQRNNPLTSSQNGVKHGPSIRLFPLPSTQGETFRAKAHLFHISAHPGLGNAPTTKELNRFSRCFERTIGRVRLQQSDWATRRDPSVQFHNTTMRPTLLTSGLVLYTTTQAFSHRYLQEHERE